MTLDNRLSRCSVEEPQPCAKLQTLLVRREDVGGSRARMAELRATGGDNERKTQRTQLCGV
jgi:hypothetical protein